MIRSLTALILPRELHERLFRKQLTHERFTLIVQAATARVLGRKIVCHRCGKSLGRMLCFVRKGRIEVWGAHVGVVRVEFADRLRLQFSHARPGECQMIRQ